LIVVDDSILKISIRLMIPLVSNSFRLRQHEDDMGGMFGNTSIHIYKFFTVLSIGSLNHFNSDWLGWNLENKNNRRRCLSIR
jgi:hypothetical protein